MSDWSHQEEQDYTKKLDLSLFKKLFVHMRRHWRNMGIIALSMAVLAVTDVILPLMTRHAIDHYVTPGLPAGAMWPFALTYLLIIAVQITAIFFFILLAGRVEFRVAYDMRQKGFRKLQELPFSYYDRMPVGYLMSRLTSGRAPTG